MAASARKSAGAALAANLLEVALINSNLPAPARSLLARPTVLVLEVAQSPGAVLVLEVAQSPGAVLVLEVAQSPGAVLVLEVAQSPGAVLVAQR